MPDNQTEIFASQLSHLLQQAQSGAWSHVPKLRGWRFDMSVGRSVSLSIVDNKLGSVYGPITSRDSLGGSLYLIWEDEKRTNASLDRLTIPEFEQRLSEWYASVYSDAQAADILPPLASYPEVEVYDPQIAPFLQGDTDEMFRILKEGYDYLIGSGQIEFVDAGVGASGSTRFVRNSLGLDISYPSSYFGYSFSADSLYGNGYAKRRLAPESELPRILGDVLETTTNLKKEATFQPDHNGNQVILAPGMNGAFFGQFISSNLSGSGVANRQVAFSLEDFQQHKAILRSDISLVIDGTRPFELSASRLTSEGIAGGKTALVEKGLLVAPSLDLKYSAITGFAPTLGGALYIQIDQDSPQLQTFDQLVSGLEHGLLIYSVLGMHTQDSTSGRFSLSAPRALVVEDGQIKGYTKTTISGNFFESVNAGESKFGLQPFEDDPAMQLNCFVVAE